MDKEFEEDEKKQKMKQKEKRYKEEKKDQTQELAADEDRWPSPMEPLEYDSDRDSPNKISPVVPPPPGMDDQTDEEKKYILEKIQQANRELQDQETPNMTRRRRLHFKETLVDLVVPPLQFEKEGNTSETEGRKSDKERANGAETETEVSGKLSELKLSPREENSPGRAVESSKGGQEIKEGKVLVEKDGKFDLVSLKEVESQGLLPPLANNYGDYSHSSPVPEAAVSTSKLHSSSSSPRTGSSSFQLDVDHIWVPKPPAHPRSRPISAGHSQRGSQGRGSKRRVQSAIGTLCQTTYSLSPQQKELLQRIQERKDRLAREVKYIV